MEEIINHKSSLLFLALVSYVCWRLSFFGARKIENIIFKIISLISLALIAFYYASSAFPVINILGSVILIVVGLWICLILPFPEFKLSIPENKKKPVIIELVSISIVTFIVMGVWQRVYP